ncbi:MAG: hypothetical protein HYZ48_05580, partial [Chlamydiales bacterium]|nr:hypothetical protein [Chlamydiales bacterium]
EQAVEGTNEDARKNALRQQGGAWQREARHAHLPSLSLSKHIKPLEGLVSCWFNAKAPPFTDSDLRKAFSFAIPRQKLLKTLLLPETLLTKGLFSSLFEGENLFSIQESQETAFELFNTVSKTSDVKTITISYEATDLFSRIASQLKSSFERVFPIQIELEPLPFKELFQRLRSGQFQMTILHAISQYTDPINFLERFEFHDLPRNFSGWENKKYRMILKNYRKSKDPKQKFDLIKKAEKILLEEMPIAPIYYEHYTYLQKPWVHNLQVSPVGIIHFDRVRLGKISHCKQEETDLFNSVG